MAHQGPLIVFPLGCFILPESLGCYLQDQLLPGHWQGLPTAHTTTAHTRLLGTLQLQGNMAPLLLQRPCQPLEAGLLLLHRGQDAGSRVHVAVLHDQDACWLQAKQSKVRVGPGWRPGRGHQSPPACPTHKSYDSLPDWSIQLSREKLH